MAAGPPVPRQTGSVRGHRLGDRRLALLSNADCGGDGCLRGRCRGLYAPSSRFGRASIAALGSPPHPTMRTWNRRRCRSSSSGVLLLLAALAGWLARRLRLPAIVGYLAVGLLVSPFTPGYVADHDQLQLLADVGVVLLLFEVGIEVDVDRLRREHGAAPLGGAAPDGASRPPSRRGRLVGRPAAVRGRRRRPGRRPLVERRHRQHHPQPATDDDPRDRGGAARLERPPGHHRRRARDRPARGVRCRRPPAAPRGRRPARVRRARGGRRLAAAAARSARLRADHDLFLIVSVASGLALAGAGAIVAGDPAGARGVRRRARRSPRAPTRPRRAAGSCRSGTCSPSSSSSRSGR